MSKSTPYQTQLRTIQIRGQEPLEIYTLLDRQQYYDPKGAAKRLGICSASWPLFGMLWPSGLQLAKKIVQRPVQRDQKLLEIGCGLGLASLMAHRLGANVTASDRHPLAQHFLSKNVVKNFLPEINYRHGQWGLDHAVSLQDTGAPLISERYDLVMGSDLLYDPSSPKQVAGFIHEVAALSSEVWVVDPNRGYRNQFSRAMAEYGFSLARDKKIQRPFAYSLEETPQPYSGRFLIYKRDLRLSE
ncbi:methyltransferase [Paenalcaligenes hominis]|uniref:class I SAM-dependent methyltransferase n=1 Tax=Paenalcaligenes hominis TaxID=643674 RepID=UPI0035248CC1